MATRAQIEAGEGRYSDIRTTIIQRGSDDVFDTARAESGWAIVSGWHIAGSAMPRGDVNWCDLRGDVAAS